MAEQIGMTYRGLRYYKRAVDYFKCQLSLAWELNDYDSEMRSYDNLAIQYYYIGNIVKARLYSERLQLGRVEQKNSNAKRANAALNDFKRERKQFHEFNQNVLKGVQVEDAEKRPNIGEYSVRTFTLEDHKVSFENQLEKLNVSASPDGKLNIERQLKFVDTLNEKQQQFNGNKSHS